MLNTQTVNTLSRALVVFGFLFFFSYVNATSLSLSDLAEFLEEASEPDSTPEEPAPTDFSPTDIGDPVITPTASQAANISRSRLAYSQASGASTSVTLPRSRNLKTSATLSGSIEFKGFLAGDIEREIERVVANSSRRLRRFFSREKRALQERADDGYFFFFQAAANFGYSDNDETRGVLQSREFYRFTNQSALILSSCEERTLAADYSVSVDLTSTGFARRVTLQAFLYFSQVTMTSGKILTLVTNSSRLVIADEDGNMYDDSQAIELISADELHLSSSRGIADNLQSP